jgi:hypothetical protein
MEDWNPFINPTSPVCRQAGTILIFQPLGMDFSIGRIRMAKYDVFRICKIGDILS